MQTAERTDLDPLAVDTVRVLAMDAIQKAGSGHPGTAMALTPAAYVLWTQFTMPRSTVEAFADHGIVRGQTVTDDLDSARRLWSDLIRVGIDEEEVGEQLKEEGVDKFAARYQATLDAIETKSSQAARRDQERR